MIRCKHPGCGGMVNPIEPVGKVWLSARCIFCGRTDRETEGALETLYFQRYPERKEFYTTGRRYKSGARRKLAKAATLSGATQVQSASDKKAAISVSV